MEREYYYVCLECKDVVCTVMGMRFSHLHDDAVRQHKEKTGHHVATFSGVGISGTQSIVRLLRGEEI